jgi:hypothetical protein
MLNSSNDFRWILLFEHPIVRQSTRLFCILLELRDLIELPYEDTGRNRSRYLQRDQPL